MNSLLGNSLQHYNNGIKEGKKRILEEVEREKFRQAFFKNRFDNANNLVCCPSCKGTGKIKKEKTNEER